MAEFVTLSCPSCGGKLQITNDIERFACSYCGQEHVVKRSGGIVSLAPVVDELKKVGAGVDKTAAELAIVRLRQEIHALSSRRAELTAKSPRPTRGTRNTFGWFLIAIGSVFGLAGIIAALNQDPSAGAGVALVCLPIGLAFIAPGVWMLRSEPNTSGWDATTGAQLSTIDDLLERKNAELRQAQDIVSQN